MTESPVRSDHPRQGFATTRWSVVVAAGAAGQEARESLEVLCRTYWHPLYFYARRRGCNSTDAEDLTQGFITSLLERNAFQRADPDRGRFRSFLLGGFNRFLSDDVRRRTAQKRGGDYSILSIDTGRVEEEYRQEPSDIGTAEDVFERRWALAVLDAAMHRLENEYSLSGKSQIFDALRTYLGADAERIPMGMIAESLGMQEGAVKVAVHRLRKRYREALRAEIAQTVAGPEDLDDELKRLFRTLGG